MSQSKHKRKLAGPWRNLHAAVWLIGLALLAWQRWWWPGILVLAAISLLLEGALMQFAPRAFVEEGGPSAAPNPVQAVQVPPPAPAPGASPAHRLELLPAACPKCGAPVRGQDVKWTGPQSADCPYCGANLPMRAGVDAGQPG